MLCSARCLGLGCTLSAPPPYHAQATVLVDFNLEQAWPKETDRQQFYYLERETRKLEEVAWSDLVMGLIVEVDREYHRRGTAKREVIPEPAGGRRLAFLCR